MLASVLPGLRDVRTPLTIGYAWLVVMWAWWGDSLPTSADQASGALARLFELGARAGQPAVLAATSVLAYLLGSVVLIPEHSPVRQWLARFSRNREAAKTQSEYRMLLADKLGRAIRMDMAEAEDALDRLHGTGAAELRPRLLVANAELYGEWDRLESEGTFRVNVGPAALALVITVAATAALPGLAFAVVAVAGGVVCGVLVGQGISKQVLAESVIQRAVLQGVIEHPLLELHDQLDEKRQVRERSPAREG